MNSNVIVKSLDGSLHMVRGSGISGTGIRPSGPTGVRGTVGDKGKPSVLCTMVYCGIVFEVRVDPGSKEYFEDLSNITGDELDFLKVMCREDFDAIREAWAVAWTKKKAFEAFDRGEFEDELD